MSNKQDIFSPKSKKEETIFEADNDYGFEKFNFKNKNMMISPDRDSQIPPELAQEIQNEANFNKFNRTAVTSIAQQIQNSKIKKFSITNIKLNSEKQQDIEKGN